MPRRIELLRNIGIIAHIDAGKTTVTERMLFYSGATHRMGDVDKGTTETDFDPEEQQRGITIYSACVSFPWGQHTINLIDTPGHVDFTAEVERSLRVLDGAVVVFSAREGVEAQSETVWRQADKYGVPRLAFINKMDREGASFEDTLEQMRKRLDTKPLPVAIPLGVGPPHLPEAFRGIIDLVEMKLLTFEKQALGRNVVAGEIPPEARVEAELWRGQLLDDLSIYSDALAEVLLEEEQPTPDLVRQVLREATLARLIVPVLCGSALDYIGIQPLLDAVGYYLPSPLDKPPVVGTNPKKKNAEESRKPDPTEPFSGLVFKVLADKHGDLHIVRIYSGTLAANTRVLNAGKDKKENAAQLWHIQADRKEQIPEAQAGDIVGVIGLRQSITGDTICDTQHPIVLESIVFPETVISMAIEPESSTERKKLADVLEMMKRQDPTFRAAESEETGQTLISGMGELHLEVIKHRLLRDFNLNVKVHKPRVSYRETVERAAEAEGECHRMIAGQQLFAKLRVKLEPISDNTAPVIVKPELFTQLPEPLLTAAVDELTARVKGAGLYGNPLIRVRLSVTGAEAVETQSTDVAFRIAAADAFDKALEKAGGVLLEPIMKLEITTPEEHVGDFVSDLQQRRGMITQTNLRGRNTVIDAEVPLSNLFGYSSAMRGLSQGRASCSMEPADYGPAPPEVAQSFR